MKTLLLFQVIPYFQRNFC